MEEKITIKEVDLDSLPKELKEEILKGIQEAKERKLTVVKDLDQFLDCL